MKKYPRGYKIRSPQALREAMDALARTYDPSESLTNLAKRVKLPRGTVSVWVASLRRQGKIPPPNLVTKPKVDSAALKEMLERGVTSVEAAERFQASRSVVYRNERALRKEDEALPHFRRRTLFRDDSLPQRVFLALETSLEEGTQHDRATLARMLGVSNQRLAQTLWRLRARAPLPYEPAIAAEHAAPPNGTPENSSHNRQAFRTFLTRSTQGEDHV